MTPWVRTLLVANAAMFLSTMSFPGLFQALALFPPYLLVRPWTVVTYMFLHANFSHILFNMIGLYFFGGRLEARLGGPQFLTLYLVSGLVGALASVIFTPMAAVVGASAAVYGVMLGYARYWPRDLVFIWGVLPIQARWLVVAMTALSLFGGFSGGGGIAHFAHLGGFLGGLIYLNILERTSPAARFKAKATAPARGGGVMDLVRWSNIRPDGLHPINRDELLRLQQKIADGFAAELTPEEKAFLNRMAGG